MNLAATLRPCFASPAAAFTSFPDTNGYVEYTTVTAPWYDKEDFTSKTGWRVDRSDAFGTLFMVVYLPLIHLTSPKRIEVRIPSQTEWPSQLWSVLQAQESAHILDERVRHLAIAKHTQLALHHWSHAQPRFKETWLNLPYGTAIVFDTIEGDHHSMTPRIVRNPALMEHFLSVKTLRHMWRLPRRRIPQAVAIDNLRLVAYLHRSVSLVRSAKDTDHAQLFVLKQRLSSISAMYHELKILLTMAPHKNIVTRPLFLVVENDQHSGDQKVVGFALQYHWRGNLLRAIYTRSEAGTLHYSIQLRWALELTLALIHVSTSSASFYSDLRTENVVLRDDESLVLIDFEQSRSVFAWAPPEIYLLEWLADLSTAKELPASIRNKYMVLFKSYLKSKEIAHPPEQSSNTYANPEHGFHFAWLTSDASKREAAMVYALGKTLWCIFEGIGQSNNILGRSEVRRTSIEFPTFRRCPRPVRRLIKQCTAGAREWDSGGLGLFRAGGRIYPRGQTGRNGEPTAGVAETKSAIIDTWTKEVQAVEQYVAAQMRYDAGEAQEKDYLHLAYLQRPTLKQVWNHLQALQMSQSVVADEMQDAVVR